MPRSRFLDALEAKSLQESKRQGERGFRGARIKRPDNCSDANWTR